jgi:hypothetical protein
VGVAICQIASLGFREALSDAVDVEADFDQGFVVQNHTAVEDERRFLHRIVHGFVIHFLTEKPEKFQILEKGKSAFPTAPNGNSP